MRQVVAYKRLKTMKTYLTVSPKGIVSVAYKTWSFSRGSNYSPLTGKILMGVIGCRLWEVVALGGSTVSISIVFFLPP